MTEFSEIRGIVKEMNISEENDLTFKSACIILYGIEIDSWNIKRIAWASGYARSEVQTVLDNLRKNRIISYLETTLDLGCEEEDEWMGFILACMAGSGDVVRCVQGKFGQGTRQLSFEEELEKAKYIRVIVNNEKNWIEFIKIEGDIISGKIQSSKSKFYEFQEIIKCNVSDIVEMNDKNKNQFNSVMGKHFKKEISAAK